MSNQPYRPGAFEIPCRADGWVAETRVPEDRPLSGVPTWMRPEQLWEVLESFVVLPFRLWANFRVWARSTEAWAEGLRARYRQRLDRGFDGSPSRSGRVRA